MTHVSGRRPPHAAERSVALIRQYRDRLQRAELLGGFVESVAHQPDRDLARLTTEAFSTRPDRLSVEAITDAVIALRGAEQRWRALPIGGQLALNWPAHRRIVAPPTGRSREAATARRRR